VISVAVRDQVLLYESYMPFIKDGGWFVPTDADYALGDVVRVSLQLMHEPGPMLIRGTVVWITPPGAQGGRPAGIGIRFDSADETPRRVIENYLAGAQGSQRPTHTL